MDITDSPKSTRASLSPRSPRSPLRDASPSASAGREITVSTTENAAGTASLFVGKLAYDCRPRELEELFGKYGRITRCDIKRGYAFVEFEDERDATDAIKYLDGTRFLGFNITVERTKGEKRAGSNPDGSKSRECFNCGRVGHYARECRSGRGRDGRMDRRGDRYEPRRDRRDRRSVSRERRSDYRDDRDRERRSDRRDYRSRSRSRSRSPVRNNRSISPRRY